ncbi:ETX/MTX2 family pore-forming toxin [Enterococcus ratti]|uniref:Uncharacterized protein n=1 Tax=Enterococcus ratti TaxID=150033 RepID=A0A1L8WQD2_9ENTE|nr:ETX/MTX2 family pore-forming toxin [Enterococcus ratti]OJG83207.1 hypothetical protein RV14_GL001902 [Enterococcus ratti]
MKKIQWLGLSIIASSLFFTTGVKANTEKEVPAFSSETRKVLQENYSLRSFPVIGNFLDEKIENLSFRISYLKFIKGNSSLDEYFGLKDYTPWATSALAVVHLNDDMEILAPNKSLVKNVTFTNSLGTAQEWETPQFNFTSSTRVTTTTTESEGISTSTVSKMEVPFEKGKKVSVNAIYDYSDKGAANNFVPEVWSIPSKKVTVEPGQTIRVEWTAVNGKAQGTASLDFLLDAVVPFKIKNGVRIGCSLNEAIEYHNSFGGSPFENKGFDYAEQTKWTIKENKAFRKFGSANYEIEKGLEMQMNVYEVSNSTSKARTGERLIASKTFSVDELRIN